MSEGLCHTQHPVTLKTLLTHNISSRKSKTPKIERRDHKRGQRPESPLDIQLQGILQPRSPPAQCGNPSPGQRGSAQLCSEEALLPPLPTRLHPQARLPGATPSKSQRSFWQQATKNPRRTKSQNNQTGHRPETRMQGRPFPLFCGGCRH